MENEDLDYLDPLEARAAQKRMARAKVRITKFQRATRAKPARPDVYTCKCGAQVFSAQRRLGKPILLEWAELEDALDAPFGWEVQLELHPMPPAATEVANDFEWVCTAIRHHAPPEDEGDTFTWELVAQDLSTPRYQVHRHTMARPRARFENAETREEDEKAITRAWQSFRAIEPTGQQAWALVRERRTAWRPPAPASEPPAAALEGSREGSDLDRTPAAARALRPPKRCSYPLPFLTVDAQPHT